MSVGTVTSAPAAAAARPVASSASGSSSRCIANGAIPSGIETGVPSSVVSSRTSPTSTSIRGRSCQRLNAATFSRSVTSSSDPPSK
ncbi:MAG TPA: hypothetical protein VE984_09700 [Gaiellaceae bacterium]|nr:hypothetical protein [Gaiellaceae bacterium]